VLGAVASAAPGGVDMRRAACGRSLGVLLIAAVLVAGCTDGADAPAANVDFATELVSAQTDYSQALRAVQQRGRQALTADDGAVVDVYADMLTVTRAARDDYARLQPPGQLHAGHARLVELLDRQTQVLERLLAAVAAEDDATVTDALQELAVVIGDWGTATAALERSVTGEA
jgi:hypothetical protein